MSEKTEKSAIQAKDRLSRRKLMQGAAALAGGTAAAAILPAAATRTSEARAAAAPSASHTLVSASPKKNIVETESGKVFGFVRNGIVTFKGIPYGASTDGKNRFMPPTKPTPWTGVRSSLHWGPVSPQAYTSTFDGRRGGWQ